MANVVGSMRRTLQNAHMITSGDRVAVGLSGGKDSMALLHALAQFRQYSPFPFELEAITIDLGFQNFDLAAAEVFCRALDIPYTVVPTEISKIVFDIRDEKNPCALCANMRRGALAKTMNARGLNKLALGHHADDALSTLLMNALYAGKLNTLEYTSFLSRTEITVIRPFLDTAESHIIHYIHQNKIPSIKSPCPMDKRTKRETTNALLSTLYKTVPHARKNLLTAMRNADQCNLF